MTKNNLKIVKSNKNQETESKEKQKALNAAINQIDENWVLKTNTMNICMNKMIQNVALKIFEFQNMHVIH